MSHHHHHHHHEKTEAKTLNEKLKILVNHWIEHNNSHMKEYEKWRQLAEKEDAIDIAEILKEVCEKVAEIDKLYKELEKLL